MIHNRKTTNITTTLDCLMVSGGVRYVNDTWKWFNDVFCSLNCARAPTGPRVGGGGRGEARRGDEYTNN